MILNIYELYKLIAESYCLQFWRSFKNISKIVYIVTYWTVKLAPYIFLIAKRSINWRSFNSQKWVFNTLLNSRYTIFISVKVGFLLFKQYFDAKPSEKVCQSWISTVFYICLYTLFSCIMSVNIILFWYEVNIFFWNFISAFTQIASVKPILHYVHWLIWKPNTFEKVRAK